MSPVNKLKYYDISDFETSKKQFVIVFNIDIGAFLNFFLSRKYIETVESNVTDEILVYLIENCLSGANETPSN